MRGGRQEESQKFCGPPLLLCNSVLFMIGDVMWTFLIMCQNKLTFFQRQFINIV